ncbi:NAD(P)H-dependent oxidoreductase [Aminobacter sp. AP02]|uniref:NADPH-dependent FMN reductase n=1 Tax=Aminobacter sp. AP02 TaxID=2135737 RepID=UPI000D6C9934|nr:NAD(P)H-dependent oxidoreductase [Aminobacter sp. AP02]PWK76932.1 chromate reductase [Aminobacter sp. AP02]
MPRNIAVLIGSLRKRSYCRMLAHALEPLAADRLQLSIIEIGGLPLYNQDIEGDATPPTWTMFRNRIRQAEGVLFITPEFNRSVPAVLKNAVDVGSRPYGQSVWDKKPAAIITISPGAMGGFGANHHLRQSLVFLNMPTVQQPEAYVGGAAELFDEAGRLKREDTAQFLRGVLDEFAVWIERHAPTTQASS